jgi:hypothetical protein
MRSVLVVDPNPSLRLSLRVQFAEYPLTLTECDGDASAALAASPDAVVAPAAQARRLVKEMERLEREPSLVLLYRADDDAATEVLARLAAEGHSFQSIECSEAAVHVARRVVRALDGRRAVRVAVPKETRLRFRLDGRSCSLAVFDVASHGLSAEVSSNFAVDRISPGVVLARASLFCGTHRLSAEGTLVVRSLRRVSSPGEMPRFVAGLAYQQVQAEPSPLFNTDALQVRATLQRALRRDEPLRLYGPSGIVLQTDPQDASLTPGGDLILSSGLDGHGLRAGDVISLVVDFGGQTLCGEVSIRSVGAGRLMLSLPRTLSVSRGREGLRFVAPSSSGWRAWHRCPFRNEDRLHLVERLDGSRVTLRVDPGAEALPPGLLLDPVVLTTAKGEVMLFRAEVETRVEPAPGGGSQVTLQLQGVSRKQSSMLRHAAVAARYPLAQPLLTVPFSDVWTLMRDSHQFFPDYPFDDPSCAPRLCAAQEALESSDGELGRAYVYCDQGRPMGHASGLRVYRRTWLMGHLAVLPGFHRSDQASRELSALALEYGEMLEDVDFVRYVWRTENRWPNRYSSWLSRRVGQESRSRLAFFHYLRCPVGALRPCPEAETVPVRRAQRADLMALEAHLRRNGNLVTLLSDDLTADTLELEQLSARFAEVGLERRREVWVVDGPDAPAAFGLLERSTQGLSWPELTNALKLVVTTGDAECGDAARRALAVHAAESNRARGMPSTVVLAADEDLAALATLGFESLGKTAEWTFARSLVGAWDNLTRAVTERFARRAAGQAARSAEAAVQHTEQAA